MLYNTKNYWVFGLCPSSGILETTTYNVRKPSNSEANKLKLLHTEEILTYLLTELSPS
jgi:hypothetical protein